MLAEKVTAPSSKALHSRTRTPELQRQKKMLDESGITDATPTVSTLLQNLYSTNSDHGLKKPPAKVLVLRQVELIDDLLMENEKQKYENLVSQMELDLGQKEKDQKKSMLKKEKNIESVKNQLLQIENENEKLKKTVNRMLTNYQKKISDLKKEKQILEDNFALVYEAHSKSKKKKLSEKLK